MLTNDTWFMYCDGFGKGSPKGHNHVIYQNIGGKDIPVWQADFVAPDKDAEQYIDKGVLFTIEDYFFGMPLVRLSSGEATFVRPDDIDFYAKNVGGKKYRVQSKMPIYMMVLHDSFKIPSGFKFSMCPEAKIYDKYIQFDTGNHFILQSDFSDPKKVNKASYMNDGGDGTAPPADSSSSDSTPTADHALDCHHLQTTKFCRKHSASPICVARIKRCEKHNLKTEAKEAELAQQKELTKQLAADSSDSPSGASGLTGGADGESDNTTYIALGVVCLMMLIGVGFVLLKKKPAVALAPIK